MKKFLYSTKQIPVYENSEDAFTLEYYILTETAPDTEGGKQPYGIEVVKRQKIDDIVYTEIKTLESICATENAVMLLIRIISENTVTPVVLEETVEEMAKDEAYKEIFEKTTYLAG